MDSVLHLIGIAKKAGRLEIGEEPVGAAARARQAKVILLAADTAANSVRRASHFGEAGNVLWLVTPYTKAELGGVVGRSSCAMMAVMDAGIASSLVQKLAAANPEKYAPAAEQLEKKAEKVLRRQQEQRQHEKNIKLGKKKPWAAPGKEGAERRISEKPEKSGKTEEKSRTAARPAQPPKPAGGRYGAAKRTPGQTTSRGAQTRRFNNKGKTRGPGRGTNTQGEGVK